MYKDKTQMTRVSGLEGSGLKGSGFRGSRAWGLAIRVLSLRTSLILVCF